MGVETHKCTSQKNGCTVGQHPWVVCCRLVIIVSEYSTGWLRIAPLFKRAIQESRSCGTFIYQIRRRVIGEWPLFWGTMGGKRWYGGNIWAQMMTPGVLSKTQEVGWRFKVYLFILRFIMVPRYTQCSRIHKAECIWCCQDLCSSVWARKSSEPLIPAIVDTSR